ncbi:MAG: aromatic ring-hydroxylating dioxygenase subunit alpha, partial [Elusimicrobiota bacterium]
CRTIIDGPVVDKVSDKKFYVYVYMRKEDGTVAKKAAELPQKNINQFKLEFIFPNLWENHINDKIRILIAFAPVDENNTILYMRFYQNMVKGKTLGKLFSWLAMPFNLKVAHQDRHVVHTQVPKVTALQMGEELFPGDLPIIHYRKRREELKKLVEGRK